MKDDSELRLARKEIRSLRAQLKDLALREADLEQRLFEEKRKNERAVGQLAALRRSLSWRLTMPVRIAKRAAANKFNADR